MGIFGDIAGPPVGSWRGRSWHRARTKVLRTQVLRTKVLRVVVLFVALDLACALAGCNANVTGYDFLVDPGRYAIYKCDDLVKRWKVVAAREKELRDLIARSDQTSGGVFVGSLAYRSDYDVVMGDERLLRRAAADKNCELPSSAQGPGGQPQGATYQSDQGIR